MFEMACDDTLRIKNLPKELSDTEKDEFLRHFGAIQVKILTSNYKQKSIAYAKFSSKEIAKSVMLRLHQTSILDCKLCIEFAKHDLTENEIQPVKKLEMKDNHKNFKSFLNKLNAWNNAVSFNQPPPPHLKYVYPKSNRATINNIAHALASVPKFYTQVLHLMNKMNLPPPFSDVPDRVHSHHHVMTRPSKPQMPLPDKSSSKAKEESSESELESDPDSKELTEIIPTKRSLPQKKTVKRPKFIKPPVAQQTTKVLERNEEIFEKVNMQPQKRIEVKVSADSLEPKTIQSIENVGSFGIINAAPKENINTELQETIKESVDDNSIITDEELAANRIPARDLSVLPVFKNYHAGAPSCRLYIKNIAKTVETKELEFIYRRYMDDSNEDKPSQFDIRLMQEGKMKGQAFVTFDSIQLAQKAVKETNGYILKDKPLVVVFARSAIPKK